MKKSISASLFSVVLFFSSSASASQILDRVAAVVVDEPILQSQVVLLMNNIQKTPALGEAYRVNPSQLKFEVVLEKIIEEKIVQVSVRELDIRVNDSDIETQINAIAKQNNITRKTLEESLAREGLSLDEYRKNIRGQLERRSLFDRELRKGGGVTETDLKALYDKSAPVELKLISISLKNNSAGKKTSEVILKSHKDKSKDFSALSSEYAGDAMGWTPVDSLDPKFGNLNNIGEGSLIGPVLINNSLQFLLVEANRKGSPEGFEKAKDELMMRAQGQDFERRFQSWLDRKRSELNIVVNKV